MDESVPNSLHHLLKSTLLSLKLISNYRSFLSLNAAFQLQKSTQTEQQIRKLYDDILSDQQQHFQMLERLSGLLLRTPYFAQLQHLVKNIQEELQALSHDAAGASLISSQVLQFTLKTAPIIPDAVSVLLSGAQAGGDSNAELQRLQKTLLEEQQASLELQKQLRVYQQQKQGYKAVNPKTADRVITLEAENQLLNENIADLRRALEQMQQENRNTKEIMQILKQNISNDLALRNRLQEENNRLNQQLQNTQQQSVSDAQIQAVQLVVSQILSLQTNGALHEEPSAASGAVSLQKGVNQVLRFAQQTAAQVAELGAQNAGYQRKIATTEQEIERLREIIGEMTASAQNQGQELSARSDEEIAKYADVIAQKDALIAQLKAQPTSFQEVQPGAAESEQMAALKQNFKLAISELRQKILALYAVLGLQPVKDEEFELAVVCEKCERLVQAEAQLGQLREGLKGLAAQGGDVKAELQRLLEVL